MNDIYLTEKQKLNKQERLKDFIGECHAIRQVIPEREIISLNRLTIWLDKRSEI